MKLLERAIPVTVLAMLDDLCHLEPPCVCRTTAAAEMYVVPPTVRPGERRKAG
jgi:hypothetical protein